MDGGFVAAFSVFAAVRLFLLFLGEDFEFGESLLVHCALDRSSDDALHLSSDS